MRVAIVTINAGSACDAADPGALLERLRVVLSPLLAESDFVALHLQELGGKGGKRPESVAQVEAALAAALEGQWVHTGLLMERDAGNSSAFTALGSLYGARRDAASDVRVWHRRLGEFVPLTRLVSERPSLRLGAVGLTRKFAESENPQGGRKGYLALTFLLHGHAVRFVNAHLPADMDNCVAVAASPSSYALLRRQLLATTLLECCPAPAGAFVLAGDLNFRLDGQRLIAESPRAASDGITSKVFQHAHIGALSGGTQLLPWDAEATKAAATHALDEQPVAFAPTYCYGEHEELDNKRCPAWPDRVLYSLPWARFLSGAVRYRSLVWGADHHAVALSCCVAPASSPESLMHHPHDGELERLGHLVQGPGDAPPRRRRGPGVVARLLPTMVTLFAVSTLFLMWRFR